VESRRAGLVVAGILAAIAGSVVLARVLPHETNQMVVTTKATAIAPRPASPYTRLDPPVAGDLAGVWSSGASLYVVGAAGTILRLDDPRAGFTAEASGTSSDLAAIAGEASGSLVAVGAHGTILERAPKSDRWVAAPSPAQDDLFGVVIDDDGTVAIGANGRVVRKSAAGWAKDTVASHAELRAVARDGSGYLAVGRGGAIATCAAPGAPWTVVTSHTGRDLFAVAVADGVAYAFGDDGIILRRSRDDGWTVDDGHTDAPLRAATHGSGTLFALGSDGTVLRLDGGRWAREPRVPAMPLAAIAFRLDSLWSFGARGSALTRRIF
jgi:photosystem II stability/assembly factor-like uncharacterized protein